MPLVFPLAGFAPMSVENVNKTNEPVPVGATQVEITLFGRAENGTTGASIGKDKSTSGGAGGDGAGRITCVIPAAALGPTFSMTLATSNGNATSFVSGGIVLSVTGRNPAVTGSGITDLITGVGGAGNGGSATYAGSGGGHGGRAQTHPGSDSPGSPSGSVTDVTGLARRGASGSAGNGGNTSGKGGNGGGGGGYYPGVGTAGSAAYMLAEWS